MASGIRERLLIALLLGMPVVLLAQPCVAHEVARIGGASIHCPAARDAIPGCARREAARLRREAEQEFIVREGLQATAAELAAVRAYDAAFRAHDRMQRRRKLEELEQRLKDTSLEGSERARLQAFRDTLARLARYEADIDAGTEEAPALDDADVARWVERSKLDATLHRRYGGQLGIDPAGPYAHGARAMLVREHLRIQHAQFLDPQFEAALIEVIEAPPLIPAPSDATDFTPFWLRPIPASYMPD